MGQVKNEMYQEYLEALAIKAASKLVKEAMECRILEDADEGQAYFSQLVEQLRERDEYYLKQLLMEGLEAIYGHREKEEFI